MKIIRDIATLADGQSADMAGVATLIAFCMGVAGVGYIFIALPPDNFHDVLEIMRSFALYFGAIITSGCTGKLLNNRAEPQDDCPPPIR